MLEHMFLYESIEYKEWVVQITCNSSSIQHMVKDCCICSAVSEKIACLTPLRQRLFILMSCGWLGR